MVLDEAFYNSLVEHPLPVRETAIRSFGKSQYGDRHLRVACVSALAAQTAEARALASSLRPVRSGLHPTSRIPSAHLKEPIALALAAYPEARVEVDDHGGLTLHPSPSPVPERRLSQG